jgi:hypothetical protein
MRFGFFMSMMETKRIPQVKIFGLFLRWALFYFFALRSAKGFVDVVSPPHSKRAWWKRGDSLHSTIK